MRVYREWLVRNVRKEIDKKEPVEDSEGMIKNLSIVVLSGLRRRS